jgi:hypothetical protein
MVSSTGIAGFVGCHTRCIAEGLLTVGGLASRPVLIVGSNKSYFWTGAAASLARRVWASYSWLRMGPSCLPLRGCQSLG